jgi:hypothetical protein
VRRRTGECQMSICRCSKREGARERGTDGASEILLFGMAEGTLQSVQQVSASASSGAAGAASATAECGPLDRRKRCTAAGTGPAMHTIAHQRQWLAAARHFRCGAEMPARRHSAISCALPAACCAAMHS